MKHELKIYPEWYNGLLNGLKTFEVRKDDREPKFAPNDELFLREFDGDKYTGRTISALVRFVLRGKYCKDGYCIMSVEVLDSYPPKPMTNYERIKDMSVEEMAEFLRNTSKNMALKLNGEYVTNDKEFILIWLESEVK